MEDDFLAENVIPKAPAGQPQSKLAVASFNAHELLYGVAATAVIRIAAENFERFGVAVRQVRMAFQEPSAEAVKVGCGAYGEGRRHALLRRAALGFFAERSSA